MELPGPPRQAGAGTGPESSRIQDKEGVAKTFGGLHTQNSTAQAKLGLGPTVELAVSGHVLPAGGGGLSQLSIKALRRPISASDNARTSQRWAWRALASAAFACRQTGRHL